jgi:uncharacterized protein with HEPN domain
MLSDASRIADVVESAQAIVERLGRHTFESFASSADAVKATFYDLTIIGEALRDLVARREPSGSKVGEDAPIVNAHPEIPWTDWIGMRDVVTHQYYRTAPEIIWRDYEDGAVERLLACCQAWLDESRNDASL